MIPINEGFAHKKNEGDSDSNLIMLGHWNFYNVYHEVSAIRFSICC